MPLDDHRRCSDERPRNFYPLLPSLSSPLVALHLLFFATPRKDYREWGEIRWVTACEILLIVGRM